MITAMVIIRLRTRPHAHNEALATGYVYGTLAILFAAEMAACMISMMWITKTFVAMYGSGILTGYFPDAEAAWLDFQEQRWDVINLASLTIMLNIVVPGTMALGYARKTYLDGRDKAAIAVKAAAAAVAGWAIALTIVTASIVLQQNHEGSQIMTTAIGFAVTMAVVYVTTRKAADHWGNGTGGGTGRRYEALKARVKRAAEQTRAGTTKPRPANQVGSSGYPLNRQKTRT